MATSERRLRSTDRGGSRESCHEVTDEVKNLLKQLNQKTHLYK